MDNVTHTLVGLMLARAGLNRGEKGGAVMVMLAANVPDIDGYSFFTDSLSYLEQHRGYMHSLVCAPAVALIPLLLVKLVTRTRITAWSYFACLVGVLSHLALDWTNAYGIRLLLPFSTHWFRLDINPLWEPVILLILILSWAVPAIIGLVGGEVSGRAVKTPRRAWAWFALMALTSYSAVRWAAHQRAISMMAEKTYRGAPATRVSAFPVPLSLLRWRGVVEEKGAIFELPVDLSSPLYVTSGLMAYTVDRDPAIDAVQSTRAFRVFGEFDQLPYWKLTPERNVTRVELLDLRFGSLRAPGFAAFAIVQKTTLVVEEAYFSLGAGR
jgi:membrane-bound metal-dependent hydrolase YbcI (DUF457 family)